MPRVRLTSFQQLQKDHIKYTKSCCPKLPAENEIPAKVDGWAALEGTYPVVSNSKDELAEMLYMHGGDIMSFISSDISQQEYMDNQLTPANFAKLQTILSNKNIKLLRRSPKISNLIQTLIERTWNKDDAPLRHFNDRGTGSFDDYEFVLSTEPHRIAGMSAYGKFTSCQDWIRKSNINHQYHNLAHRAWSNLLDPTVGVAFIREKRGPGTGKRTVKRDMLGRALVRVLPLNNGHYMVYLHRFYGKAPHVNFIRQSFLEATRNLPANYHVVDMTVDSPRKFRGEINGEEVSGYAFQKFKLKRKFNSLGISTSYATPYNDHSGWLDFKTDSIKFLVPSYFSKQPVYQPETKTEEVETPVAAG